MSAVGRQGQVTSWKNQNGHVFWIVYDGIKHKKSVH